MLNISFKNSNYDHSALVNNPPYISNYPFLEYMESKRIDLSPYDKVMLKQAVKQQKKEVTCASCLLGGAITSIVAPFIYIGYKIKQLLNNPQKRIKNVKNSIKH